MRHQIITAYDYPVALTTTVALTRRNQDICHSRVRAGVVSTFARSDSPLAPNLGRRSNKFRTARGNLLRVLSLVLARRTGIGPGRGDRNSQTLGRLPIATFAQATGVLSCFESRNRDYLDELDHFLVALNLKGLGLNRFIPIAFDRDTSGATRAKRSGLTREVVGPHILGGSSTIERMNLRLCLTVFHSRCPLFL